MTVRRLTAGLCLAVAVVVLAGCGGHSSGSSSRPSPNANVTLSVRSVAGLGPIIVTHGWTLYMYPPDQQRHVTCTTADDCDTAWPPLLVGAGRKVIAGTGVQQRLIGTMAGDGGRVVTYNHWPLYYYIADRSPGALNGQGQGFNWYVMAPNGRPNKSHFASPSG
jgi:predicted lipoprotein with Yx(FWY)xxD motif